MRTPTQIKSVLLLGACFFDQWAEVIKADDPTIVIQHEPFDRAVSMSMEENYDLRLVQFPLRLLYPEFITMRNSFDDVEGYEEALDHSLRRMKQFVGLVGGANPDRPTFFLNYPFPQQSGLGRLMPRYDPRSPTYFIQRLNRRLHDLVANYPGGHILDIEQLAGTFGRHRFQDDGFWSYSHGGMLTDWDWYEDRERLEPEEPLSKRFPRDVEGFIRTAWREAMAMLRTIRGDDRVKMICVDLDDTLWRGVMAETDEFDPRVIEGWPIGFAEALLICKQRGIILGVVSKNDEETAIGLIERTFQGRITIDDFAVRRINWQPKPQNVAEAIAAANVLPESVLFIDDNPLERAAVKALLPDIRLLGAPHLDWRRILLWSPETQVAHIGAEAARRSAMVRAQVEREQDRASQSYAEFIADLDVRIELSPLSSTAASDFARALELINKTNQFNTTGRRWTHAEAEAHFKEGGRWWVFRVADRYTGYGLVGVIVVRFCHIDQFVMSCRVFGLQVEAAVLVAIRSLEPQIATASVIETPKNLPCRRTYERAGWIREDEQWRAGTPEPLPDHVRIMPEIESVQHDLLAANPGSPQTIG